MAPVPRLARNAKKPPILGLTHEITSAARPQTVENATKGATHTLANTLHNGIVELMSN
jgi:hypothetical protein